MRSKADEDKKFRELILYVGKLTEADPRCGSTKLNKVLFYADFGAYRQLGRAISDQRYRKQEYGPVPAGLVPVVAKMEKEGVCAWAERSYFGLPLRKLIPLREPDLSEFRAEELELVRSVISDLWELNATEVSDLSHRFVGWQAAGMGEEISYNSVFVGEPRPLSDEETEWALDALREFRERRRAS